MSTSTKPIMILVAVGAIFLYFAFERNNSEEERFNFCRNMRAEGSQTLGEVITGGKNNQSSAGNGNRKGLARHAWFARTNEEGEEGKVLEEGKRYKAIVCGKEVEFFVLRIWEGGEWADVMVERLNGGKEMREGKIMVEMCGLIMKLE